MTKIHPLSIITAVSVIIFSVLGIAAVTGQMSLGNPEPGGPAIKRTRIEPNITPIFVMNRASAPNAEQTGPCANCAVVDSITINETKAAKGEPDLVSGHVGDQTAANSSYLVKVRMDDGSYRVVSQQDRPAFHVGEKVKIVNGAVVQLESTAVMDQKRAFALMLATLTSRFF
jgi:hypothetical protein